jgi:thioester reductase-like protein
MSSGARLLFVSSISVGHSWNLDLGGIPETVLPSPESALGSGYGQSKFVAEHVRKSSLGVFSRY